MAAQPPFDDRVVGFPPPCRLRAALLGRWLPGPSFQAKRLSGLAAICDEMQLGSLLWILK
jgi:hypothetical protein